MIKKDMAYGVCYARYSSHNQKDASIEQQVAACKEKATEFGIALIESYEDRAMTGKNDKRPAFQKMMRDAEKGTFQYVVAWKSNRMGRNMLEAMMNESKLQDYGIRVIYVEESFEDNAAGRFALRSMMNVNQFYSENMAEDIKRALFDNAEKCKVTNGNLPFGYKADANLKYVLDSPKDDIVREIYTRVSNGEPLIDIARSLNARGIKTSTGSDWGRSSFHSILRNERYRGIYIYSSVRIEGGIPRIVSDELFFRVQEVLKTKKNAQGKHRVNGDYLLTGKLYCGKCKSPMVGYSGTGKNGTLYHYYVCQDKMKHKCNQKYVKRELIEESVVKAIMEYALNDDVIDWIADKTIKYYKKKAEASHISILENRLSDTEKAINNIMSAIEQGIITSTTKERLLSLEKEKSEITAKISVEKAEMITLKHEDIIAGISLFKNGDINDAKFRARLLNAFVVAVYWYGDNDGDDDKMDIVFSFDSKHKKQLSVKDSKEFVLTPQSLTKKRMNNLFILFYFNFR